MKSHEVQIFIILFITILFCQAIKSITKEIALLTIISITLIQILIVVSRIYEKIK